MSKENRLLDSEVTTAILKPEYLFLSADLPAGETFKFVSQDKKDYGTEGKSMSVFLYADSKEKIYSFSQFDVLSFQVNGVPISKTLKSIVGAQAYIVSEFKLISSDIRIDATTKKQMRPYFCYTGFETYKQNKAIGTLTKSQLKQALLATDPKVELKDLFYRSLNVDRTIIDVEVEK